MQFYLVLSLTAKKVPQSFLIYLQACKRNYKPNDLPPLGARTALIRLVYYCVVVRICAASVLRSSDSERKRFGAAEHCLTPAGHSKQLRVFSFFAQDFFLFASQTKRKKS